MSSADGAIVVALGGNAIVRFGDDGTVESQYRRAAAAMREVARLACAGRRIVVTHGNGPVVGNIVLRGELARDTVPATPLFIAGADSEGGIGLMLQQVLGNELRRCDSPLVPATLVTQVVVDPDDPAFARPTKPIGPYFTALNAERVALERGWVLAEEPGRGWRRVVPSPRPRRIVEEAALRALLGAATIPIAAGGGGVPVVESPTGELAGVDAVIDKDWTSAVMAAQIDAGMLIILMEADALYERFGEADARRIDRLSAREAAELAERLPKGSVGPKAAAAAWLAERGIPTLMCRAEDLERGLDGVAGTLVVPG